MHLGTPRAGRLALALSVPVVLALLSLSSCGGGQSSARPTASASATAERTPNENSTGISGGDADSRLLIVEVPESGTMVGGLARVRGRLGLNDQGCYTVGRAVLLANVGSKRIASNTIQVTGQGTYGVGQMIDTGGSYARFKALAKVPSSYRGCVAVSGPYLFVILDHKDDQ